MSRFSVQSSYIQFHCVLAATILVTSLLFSNTAAAGNMPILGRAATPIGYLQYCLANRDDCKRRDAHKVVENAQNIAIINSVQTSVNRMVRPVSDDRNFSKKDFWTVVKNGRGDCEDYSLTKRQLLIKAGFAPSSLLLATALNQHGEPHVVLVVRTEKQDYVLDNLYENVQEWQYMPYKWLAIQDAHNPLHWKKTDNMQIAQLQRVVR